MGLPTFHSKKNLQFEYIYEHTNMYMVKASGACFILLRYVNMRGFPINLYSKYVTNKALVVHHLDILKYIKLIIICFSIVLCHGVSYEFMLKHKHVDAKN